jgi:hypothetical protein
MPDCGLGQGSSDVGLGPQAIHGNISSGPKTDTVLTAISKLKFEELHMKFLERGG